MANLPKLEKEFIENLVNEPIEHFTVKKGCEKGDNVAGDIFAVQVVTRSKRTLNLVYKSLPENNPMLKTYAIENRIFELEINLYTVVNAKVQELVKAYGTPDTFKGPSVGLALPKYYGGICDGENSYLVLEDERPNGYCMSNKYIGYSLAEVTVILQELARFHAFTYFLLRQEGEKFFSSGPGLENYAKGFWNEHTPENIEMSKGLYNGAYIVGLKLIEEKIGGPELAAKIRNKIRLEDAATIARKTARMTDQEAFPVIIHGDCWNNNVLMKYDPVTGSPVAAKFIDFQQIRRGNVYEDLLYFIFTSTTADFRKQHLLQALYVYYDFFLDNLSKLGNCPSPLYFSRGNFIDGFYKGYLPIYVYMLFAIPLQLGVPEDDPNNQSNGGSEGPEPLEWDPKEKLEKLYLSNETAMRRLEEMTREFVELGLF